MCDFTFQKFPKFWEDSIRLEKQNKSKPIKKGGNQKAGNSRADSLTFVT